MTLDELEKIGTTERAQQKQFAHHINVCVAAGCLSSHSDQIKDALDHEVSRRAMESWCQVKSVGCLGLCAAGPLVAVASQNVLYRHVKPDDAPEILKPLAKNR